MTAKRRLPLTKELMDRRDEIISRLHGKKKFIVSHDEPHASIRVEGYNSGLDDAIKLLQEYL